MWVPLVEGVEGPSEFQGAHQGGQGGEEGLEVDLEGGGVSVVEAVRVCLSVGWRWEEGEGEVVLWEQTHWLPLSPAQTY